MAWEKPENRTIGLGARPFSQAFLRPEKNLTEKSFQLDDQIRFNVYFADYGWYFTMLRVEKVTLLDYYGGPTIINVREYLSSPPY